MKPTKEQLTERLISAVRDLPEDKVLTALRFVEQLQSPSSFERGSAEAISQALDRTGPLQFESGEVDSLLADIERMRELDLEECG